jgi:hypothetical protein
VTPKNAYILFYQINPKICNLATIVEIIVIYHTIMHAMCVCKVCVHIYVLLIKQNIC